jgi:hypothetical protein
MKNISARQHGWYRCLFRYALGLLAGAALAACSGGGGSMGAGGFTGGGSGGGVTTQSCGDCGTTLVSVTDAPGDFVSYIVNITSLKLTRADGTLVETVPATTQVDLAQLVNLSEILSSSQLPGGRYVSAALTVDYGGATIVVDNGSGMGVTIAPGNIINGATGKSLAAPNSTQMVLTLSLPSDQQLNVSARAIANLALDFNLAASNTVGPSTSNPTTVTVNPVLTASLAPDSSKQLRVRGPLVSVSTTADSYLINVLPFYQASSSSSTAGQFTVNATSTTTYSISGTSYTGSAGLTALSKLSAGTLTVAYGTWNQTAASFTATEVLAGSSVAGTSSSSVQGTVLARSGNTLTLSNGLVQGPRVAGISFMTQVTATVGSGTAVTEQGASAAFTIADISVGQHVLLSGTLSAGTGGSANLDATSGTAELLITPVAGTVTAVASNVATLNLASLDGRTPASFNFSGTGTSNATNATATAYTVAVPAALGTSALGVGLPATFSGFVTPFGSAPPDFSASTLVSYANSNATFVVRWAMPGVTAPFATLTGSELLISQAQLKAASFETIRIADISLDPSTLSSGLALIPNASATTQGFAIVHAKSFGIDSYSSFNNLATALSTDLNGTTTALQVVARGPYNATTGAVMAAQLVVVLDN